jgi:hypothetical protein
MKTQFLKFVREGNRCCRIALFSFVCLLTIAVTPVSAQSPNQKRITTMQLGTSAEGSRVTIVSDADLSDYEAFRRRDRFYVRMPLAEVVAVLPHLRGDGFEDMQVQKIGNSVVASFKLQPGANARVDQHSNKLDVIFSAPNRRLQDNSASSTPIYGEGLVTETEAQSYRAGSYVGRNKATNKQSAVSNAASAKPLPGAAPSATPASTSSTSQQPLTIAPPASEATSPPATDSSAFSTGLSNGKPQNNSLLQWISENRVELTLPAILLFVGLIPYFARIRRRRGRT